MMHARTSEHTEQTPAHHHVVLVHGLGMSGRYMMPTAERLTDFATVLVPDLPGFGQSDKPPQALTIAELADYLAWWMDAMNITRAVFVGNSFGTQIIVELAMRFPARVERQC
jgi:pimeloyl-ACP methyl ester carboxylesterase